jgi:peptide-methionine (R)-S-oxide reductase
VIEETPPLVCPAIFPTFFSYLNMREISQISFSRLSGGAAIALIFLIMQSCMLKEHTPHINHSTMDNTGETVQKTDEEWKSMLTPLQYAVLREKATERPYTGMYDTFSEKGTYVCAGCGLELFSSEHKFDPGCGWPSFMVALTKGAVKTSPDLSHNMVRTEILCSRCGGHLGHVFDDGPAPSGLRYCVNSVALDFIPAESEKQ